VVTAETHYPAAPASHRERHHRSARRQNVIVLVTASLLGLWLGATAPSVSPASPQPAPATTSTSPTQVVDNNPAPVGQAGPPGPGGRRR
jgi:hypothetical protein